MYHQIRPAIRFDSRLRQHQHRRMRYRLLTSLPRRRQQLQGNRRRSAWASPQEKQERRAVRRSCQAIPADDPQSGVHFDRSGDTVSGQSAGAGSSRARQTHRVTCDCYGHRVDHVDKCDHSANWKRHRTIRRNGKSSRVIVASGVNDGLSCVGSDERVRRALAVLGHPRVADAACVVHLRRHRLQPNGASQRRAGSKHNRPRTRGGTD